MNALVERPQWGFSGSPLVLDDKVFLNVSTWGLALNKDTGRLIWQNGKRPAGYATAVPYTMDNQKCIAIFGCKGVKGVVAATGEGIREYPWETTYDLNAADPIIEGDRVFITTGYNRGCAF